MCVCVCVYFFTVVMVKVECYFDSYLFSGIMKKNKCGVKIERITKIILVSAKRICIGAFLVYIYVLFTTM